MAYDFYISIKGTKQGQIKGSHQHKWIRALSFNMGMSSPVDQSTGQASGKRQHKPVVVSLPWGDSSPQIFSALTTHEVLESVVIQISGGASQHGGAGGQGSAQGTQWVKLHNSCITHVSTHTVTSGGGSKQVQDVTFTYEDVQMGTDKHTTAADDWEVERLALAFQKISSTYQIGKVAAADDWTL